MGRLEIEVGFKKTIWFYLFSFVAHTYTSIVFSKLGVKPFMIMKVNGKRSVIYCNFKTMEVYQ